MQLHSSNHLTCLACTSCQFSQGRDPQALTVREVVENFARNHERRMAQKVQAGRVLGVRGSMPWQVATAAQLHGASQLQHCKLVPQLQLQQHVWIMQLGS